VEAAIDLTMGIEYGRNILQTVEEVRSRISERVQNMTGLRVTELNVTISDIIFPEEGGKRPRALESGTTTEVSPRSRTQLEGASGPLGYFVAVLQAVLVLGAVVALITAFTAGMQWLGRLTEGSGRPGTQIERTHPSTTAEGPRPTTNIEEETTTSITEPPPPPRPPSELPTESRPPPRPPPESLPTATATAAATAQYAQYATATATASPTATGTATATFSP
jgi:Asp23 family, cell envelope-related function